MDDTELAELAHENFVAVFTWITARLGGLDRSADGLSFVVSGVPIALFNNIVPTADRVKTEALRAAIDEIRTHDVPFVVMLRDGIDDHLQDAALAAGLVRDPTPMPAMVVHPLPPATSPEPVPGLDVRRVDDAAGFDDHLSVIAEAFGMPESLTRRFMDVGMLDDPDLALFVGSSDGAAVATAMAFRVGRTVGIYNVGTRESARRRGYGASLTSAAVAHGLADGAEVAILQSSPMARATYERLGFRTVLSYLEYAEPAAEPAPG